MKELTEQVNLLTLPNRHDHWVPGPQGLRLQSSHTLPLLDLLRESVYSGSGGYGRGGTAKDQRAIIDPGAFAMYEDIRRGVHSLLEEAVGVDRVGPLGEPKDELRRWHRLYLRQITDGWLPATTEAGILLRTKRVRGWATSIADKFDPPKQKEILIPCPNCGKRYAEDELGDRSSALVAELREGQPSMLRCKACHHGWTVTEFQALTETVA